MKLAVLSDIHGNLPALQATLDHVDRWQPDSVVVNGDVINRGPRSRACWELIAARHEALNWKLVRGNHEEYVAKWPDSDSEATAIDFEIYQSSYWTFQQMRAEQMDAVASLPEQVSLQTGDGGVVRLTHGSMRGNTDGIYVQTSDHELREQIAPAPRVFCTAHTHRPLIRTLNGTLVVNSGSAGTAFDGDPRISYARLVWRRNRWTAEIVRLDYDRRAAARDFERSGYFDEGGPLVEIFFEEWKRAQPLVNRWAATYEEAVRNGQLSVRQSVHAFLQSIA